MQATEDCISTVRTLSHCLHSQYWEMSATYKLIHFYVILNGSANFVTTGCELLPRTHTHKSWHFFTRTLFLLVAVEKKHVARNSNFNVTDAVKLLSIRCHRKHFLNLKLHRSYWWLGEAPNPHCRNHVIPDLSQQMGRNRHQLNSNWNRLQQNIFVSSSKANQRLVG